MERKKNIQAGNLPAVLKARRSQFTARCATLERGGAGRGGESGGALPVFGQPRDGDRDPVQLSRSGLAFAHCVKPQSVSVGRPWVHPPHVRLGPRRDRQVQVGSGKLPGLGTSRSGFTQYQYRYW